MRFIATLFLMVLSTLSVADQRILLPNGTGCWINNVGHVYGCSGGPSTSAPSTPNRSPSTCIELEAEIASIKRRLRQGYRAGERKTLKAKRSEYKSLHRKHCD